MNRRRRERRRSRLDGAPRLHEQRRSDATPGPLPPLLSPTVFAIVAANCVPIVGVLLWHWDIRSLMLLYWAESAVIGLFNVVKMIRIAPWPGIPLSLFFCVHYGGFMAGHLVFIIALTSAGFTSGRPEMEPGSIPATLREAFGGSMWIAVAALFVSHAFSYVRHYVIGREPLPPTPSDQMHKPYVRIVLMHVTLLLGAAMVLATGAPTVLLLLLIVGKTALDIRAHRREHRLAPEPAVTTTV